MSEPRGKTQSGHEPSATPAHSPMVRFAWLAFAVLLTVAGALLLYQFRSVVLTLAAALVLAASIRPLVGWLGARGLPVSIGATMMVLLMVLGLLLVIGLSGYLLAEDLPRAATGFQLKYAQVRSGLAEQSGWKATVAGQMPELVGLEDLVARTQLEPLESAPVADGAGAAAADSAIVAGSSESSTTSANGSATTSERRASGFLRLIVTTTSGVAGLLTQFIVLVFLCLYWLLDRERFERLWLSLLPPDKRRGVRATWHELDHGVGAHVRSELVQAVLAFILLYVGFSFIGADFALLMAWVAALAWMIPLVGWLAALVPVVALALLTSPEVALGAALYLTIVLSLLEFVVEPRLDIRRRAGSILGLVVALVMLQSLGVIGLIFASTVAVGVQILASSWQAIGSKPAVAEDAGAKETLHAHVAELRALMGQAETEIPLQTRSLYERLQTLVIEAEKEL